MQTQEKAQRPVRPVEFTKQFTWLHDRGKLSGFETVNFNGPDGAYWQQLLGWLTAVVTSVGTTDRTQKDRLTMVQKSLARLEDGWQIEYPDPGDGTLNMRVVSNRLAENGYAFRQVTFIDVSPATEQVRFEHSATMEPDSPVSGQTNISLVLNEINTGRNHIEITSAHGFDLR